MTQTGIKVDTSTINTGCVFQMKTYFKLVTLNCLITMVFLNVPFLSLAQERASITPVIQTEANIPGDIFNLSLIHI